MIPSPIWVRSSEPPSVIQFGNNQTEVAYSYVDIREAERETDRTQTDGQKFLIQCNTLHRNKHIYVIDTISLVFKILNANRNIYLFTIFFVKLRKRAMF